MANKEEQWAALEAQIDEFKAVIEGHKKTIAEKNQKIEWLRDTKLDEIGKKDIQLADLKDEFA